MVYVVDTNIISEIMKEKPDERVIDWFIDNTDRVYITAVTILELRYGINRMPEGRRKTRLKNAIDAIVKDCAGKTYNFDGFSAHICADLRLKAEKAGRTPQIADLMIAAICLSNCNTLATRNVKDFDYLDVPIVNPFEYKGSPVLARLKQQEAERAAAEAE